MATPIEKENTLAFKFNFSDWRMRQFIAFQESVQAQDLRSMIQQMSGTVVEWFYEGDPTNPDSWMDLDFKQWSEVSKAFNQALTASFR
jgi:hypothetical protein